MCEVNTDPGTPGSPASKGAAPTSAPAVKLPGLASSELKLPLQETLSAIVRASHPEADINTLKGTLNALADKFEKGDRSPELLKLLAASFSASTERFGPEIQPEVKRCTDMLQSAKSADLGVQKELSTLKYLYLGILKDKESFLSASSLPADKEILGALASAKGIVGEPALRKELAVLKELFSEPKLDSEQQGKAFLKLASLYYQTFGKETCQEQYLDTCKSAMKKLAASEESIRDPRGAFLLGHCVWNEMSPGDYKTLLSGKPEHIVPTFVLTLTALKDPKADLRALGSLPETASADLQSVLQAKRQSLGIEN